MCMISKLAAGIKKSVLVTGKKTAVCKKFITAASKWSAEITANITCGDLVMLYIIRSILS